ncbi:Kv channel-interacting protein 4 [Hondaea fermentalgiana]|uniref:Kv channel-interacting protein 4 n=1 Tax=Hondaea fermentalgiana TaxID=2315210 RepID=A0A2R5GLN8_9STRA|nr:Kv channel-interacting protein 4 [Hondaea fermentalgiana]|eukprot:GBG31229.1 Kv channel-interacting protein 4 [Hondaea fermentalgiana]
MASGYLVCAWRGREATLPLYGDPERLVQHCASAFGVRAEDVIGFAMDNTLYPASLVGRKRAAGFGGRRMNLVVKLTHDEEGDAGRAQREPGAVARHAHRNGRRAAGLTVAPRGSQPSPLSSQSQFLRKVSTTRKGPLPSTPRERRSLRYSLVGNQSVLVTRKDLIAVRLMRQALEGLSLSASALMDLFSFESQDLLSKTYFTEIVEEHLCPAGVGSPTQCAQIRGLLLRAFYALDVFGEERVPVREVLCGLIMLTSGELELKFAYMFQLFDTDQDGSLHFGQLARILRALLTFALAFSDGMSRLPSRYVYSLVDETCEAALQTLPAETDANVSLRPFWEWYSTIGHNLMPWVELYESDINVANALRWLAKLDPFAENSTVAPPAIVALMSEGVATSPLRRQRGARRARTPTSRAAAVAVASPTPASPSRLRSLGPNNSFLLSSDGDDSDAIRFDRRTWKGKIARDESDSDEGGADVGENDDDEVNGDYDDSSEEDGAVDSADPLLDGSPEAQLEGDAQTLPLFRFALCEDKELVLMPIDAELVDLIVSTTRISDTGAEQMYSLFLNAVASQPGPDLSKECFDECIRELVPGELLGKQEQRYLSYTFSTFFYAFDRASEDRVPTDEFLGGFMLLASGSKSQKLSLAFSLFDTDGDGAIDSIGLVRYLRSFLTFLFALQKDAPKLDAEEIYTTIDRTGVEVARAVYEHFGKTDTDTVSFEEFGEWYNHEGHEAVPWLELVDLGKWPIRRNKSASAAASSSAMPSSSGKTAQDVDGEGVGPAGERLVFLVPLRASATRDTANRASLSIMTSDVDCIENLLRCTRLDEADADEIYAALLRASRGSDITIHRDAFIRAVREMVRSIAVAGADSSNEGKQGERHGQSRSKPEDAAGRQQNDAAEEEAEMFALFSSVEDRLRRFFKLFETNSPARAATDQLACALSLLAQGNKSDKLAVGFALFDRDRDGALTQRELVQFLTALLLGLHGLTSVLEREGLNKVQAISAAAATEAVAAISEYLGGPKRPGAAQTNVSFGEFAQWYAEGGGCERIPWVELYDLAKWPLGGSGMTAVSGQGSGLAASGGQSGENEEWQRLSDEVILHFNIGGDADIALGISRRDAYFVREVADLSGLRLMTAESLYGHLLQYSVRRGGLPVLRMESFMAMVNDLLDRAPEQPAAVRQRLMRAFITLFGLFETQASVGRGAVRANALFAGLLFFAAGRKSDKFSLAFSSFDEDEDGALTRAQLHSFLLAFLMGLRVLPVCSGKRAGPVAHDDAADLEQLSEATVLLAGAILTQTAARRAHSGAISFEEFCAWYSSGGSHHMAWLELLDLRKWQHALDFGTTLNSSGESPRRKSHSTDEGAAQLGEVSIDDGDADVIFRFVLTSRGETMEFRRQDVAQLHKLLAISELHRKEASSVYKVLAFAGERVAGERVTDSDVAPLVLSRAAFQQVIRQLIPGNRLSEEDKRGFSVLFASIFAAFDRSSSTHIPLVEFACGFTVLAKGSKSDKLAHAFDRFDRLRTGYLSGSMFRQFLSSFLTFLLALNEEACRQPAGKVWAMVDRSVDEIAARVFADLGLDEKRGPGITFRQIADWYTQEGGHEVMPWLELLSVSKWPLL